MWNIRAIFKPRFSSPTHPAEREQEGLSLFVIKYLQAAAFIHSHRAEKECVYAREEGCSQAGGSLEESSTLLCFNACLSELLCVCVLVGLLAYTLAAWDGLDSFPISLNLPPLSFPYCPPSSLHPFHPTEGSSHRPHDEGRGPAKSSPFLHVRRYSITSTSTPGRTQTHPQCFLRGL